MRKATLSEAITLYFKTTTLHGFKYLCSTYFVDRVGWLLCCCASACCAGMLCAVLWSRFQEVPALLTLRDFSSSVSIEEKMPAVVVCPPIESVTDVFLDKLSWNNTKTDRISISLGRLLNGNSADKKQLELLHDILVANNITLSEVMMKFTPTCKEHTKKCRYQDYMVPCDQLFDKELTIWGLCCVMQPKKLKKLSETLFARTQTTEKLDLVLECSQGAEDYGMQIITMYESNDYLFPEILQAGNLYLAQMKFTAVPGNPVTNNIVEKTCVPDKGYSRTICMLKCAERACGCSDPLDPAIEDSSKTLPMCPVTRLGCLKSSEFKANLSCNCLPSCRKMTSDLVLESSPLTALENTIDGLYAEVNAISSIVVNLRVNLRHSHIFVLNPTETWLTLLSSLGGVFNMFLGVGLFSALELIFLVMFRLPIILKKSSEIDPVKDVMRNTSRHINRPITRY